MCVVSRATGDEEPLIFLVSLFRANLGALMKGVMKNQYTSRWDRLIELITGDPNWSIFFCHQLKQTQTISENHAGGSASI